MTIVHFRRILTMLPMVLVAVAGLTLVAASPAVAGQAPPIPQLIAADPQPREVRAVRVNPDGTICAYAQAGTTVPNTGDFLMLDSIY